MEGPTRVDEVAIEETSASHRCSGQVSGSPQYSGARAKALFLAGVGPMPRRWLGGARGGDARPGRGLARAYEPVSDVGRHARAARTHLAATTWLR